MPLGWLIALAPEIIRGLFGVIRDALAARKARAEADKAEAEAREAEAEHDKETKP